MDSLIVACVLKSGGDFSHEYVYRLRNGASRFLGNFHKFMCLSDVDVPGVATVPLIKEWPGWYSKIELFRRGVFGSCPVLYLDLDTVLVRPFTIDSVKEGGFTMLMPFNRQRRRKGRLASGVMLWRGDFSFIFDEFDGAPRRGGDQEYVFDSLRTHGIAPSMMGGAASYKWHCTQDRFPKWASVVCFHGSPRPHEIREGWVPKLWT